MSTRATMHYIIAVGPHWSEARPSGPSLAAWTAGLVAPQTRRALALGLRTGPPGVQAVARRQLPPAEEGRVSPVLPTARLLEDPQDRGLPGFLTNTLLTVPPPGQEPCGDKGLVQAAPPFIPRAWQDVDMFNNGQR